MSELKEPSTLAHFGNLRLIGKGSFGRVYRARRLSDGLDYALKEVDIRHMTQKQRDEAVNEARVLASISHAKVIRYYDAFLDHDRLYIVTEFARYGDLFAKIKRQISRGKLFDEETVWSIFIQVAQGLQAVHARNVLHRDIKTPNIFVCSATEVKIGDLGVAKVMKAGLAQTQIGTPYYMSPEIWRGRSYNKKSDIWSLGCLLYELSSLRRPFEANDERSLAQKVFRGMYSPLDHSLSPELHQLVKQCLSQDPSQRPGIDEILAMPCVVKRIKAGLHVDPKEPLDKGKALMATIKVPRDLRLLSNRLPLPAYSPFRSKSCVPVDRPALQERCENIITPSSPVANVARQILTPPAKENIGKQPGLPVLYQNPRDQNNNGYQTSPSRLPHILQKNPAWLPPQRRSTDDQGVAQQFKAVPPAGRRSVDDPYGRGRPANFSKADR